MPYSDVASDMLYDLLKHVSRYKTVTLSKDTGMPIKFSRRCPKVLQNPALWVWFKARNK